MSMLAESRRRKSYVLQPRVKPLYECENHYGKRILEKMGWSQGKGLGVNEDGKKDFIQTRYKTDTHGLGYKERDDQWTQHDKDFTVLLQSLHTNNTKMECSESADLISPITESEKTLQKQISGISLEAISKQSRARVHYKKFAKVKDITQYSEKDLANILGKKSSTPNDIVPNEMSMQYINNNGTEIINAPLTVDKKSAKKPKRGHVKSLQILTKDTENSIETSETCAANDKPDSHEVNIIEDSDLNIKKEKIKTDKIESVKKSDNSSCIINDSKEEIIPIKKSRKEKSKKRVKERSESNSNEEHLDVENTEQRLLETLDSDKKSITANDIISNEMSMEYINNNGTEIINAPLTVDKKSAKKLKRGHVKSLQILTKDNENSIETSETYAPNDKPDSHEVNIIEDSDLNIKKEKIKADEIKSVKKRDDSSCIINDSNEEIIPIKKSRKEKSKKRVKERNESNSNEEHLDVENKEQRLLETLDIGKKNERCTTESLDKSIKNGKESVLMPPNQEIGCERKTKMKSKNRQDKNSDKNDSSFTKIEIKEEIKPKKKTKNKDKNDDANKWQTDQVELRNCNNILEQHSKNNEGFIENMSKNNELVHMETHNGVIKEKTLNEIDMEELSSERDKSNNVKTMLDGTKTTNCTETPTLRDPNEPSDVESYSTLSYSELKAKYDAYNVYTISSFCAEKFRHVDIKRFAGASFGEINGYGIDEETRLNVDYSSIYDDERITKLWRNVLDKYEGLEQKKKTYTSYMKAAIKARKHKLKKPPLNVKTWKRKKAFNVINIQS